MSAEDLAALFAEAAQDMGFTEPPADMDDRKAVLRHAHHLHKQRLRQARHDAHADRYARRRARKLNATVETFTRAEIIERDHATCYLCGKHCDPDDIHLDHVIPLSRGGEHSRANVKVACSTCNVRKGALLPSEWPGYTAST